MRRRTCPLFALALLAALCLPVSAAGPEDAVGALPRQLTSILEQSPGCGGCELGNLAADCVRLASGADLAIVPAGALKNDLPAGVVRQKDVECAVDGQALAVADVTPAQLFVLLEGLLSRLCVDPETETLDQEKSEFAGFPQISGFTMTVDVSAGAGERLYTLGLDDGTRLDRQDGETVLTLAAPAELLSGGYGPALPGGGRGLDQDLTGVVAEGLGSGTLMLDGGVRIRFIGAGGNGLVRQFPLYVLFPALAVMAAFAVFFHCKQASKRDFLPMQEGETRRRY